LITHTFLTANQLCFYMHHIQTTLISQSRKEGVLGAVPSAAV